MNIVDLLDGEARSRPDTPAIIDGPCGRERVLTYAALETRSRRLASLFAEAGLQPGDGVAVMLPMSADLYAVIAAAWRLGLVPVFIDPAAGEEHFRNCVRRYPVRAFVGIPAACLLRLTSRALRSIPLVFVSGAFFPGASSLRTARRLSLHEGSFPCADETPAMLAFTSGSTGRPKGILRTHGLLLATHTVLSSHVGSGPGEVVVATMPVFALTNLACGTTSLIPAVDLRHPAAIDPVRLIAQMERWRARAIVASPALLERVADYCLASAIRIECLQDIFAGGAPVFPRLLDKLAKVVPQAVIRVLYGSTEAEPIAMVSAADVSPGDVAQTMQGRGILVGRPIPEISLRILHDRWGSARGAVSPTTDPDALPPGQAGEIVVAGPHVAPGYLGGEGDAETKFRIDGRVWHRTGDAGWLDDRGRLWLLGRCSARIEDAHGVLYPYAVEAAVSSQSGIVRSAFLSHGGERLLVLEARRGVQPDVQALLGPLGWARIAAVVLVGKIPVDARHNAKVDYPALRQILDSGKWLSRIDSG